jgi:molybdopterin-binding protein
MRLSARNVIKGKIVEVVKGATAYAVTKASDVMVAKDS